MNDLSMDRIRLYLNGADITHTVRNIEFFLATDESSAQEGISAPYGVMDEIAHFKSIRTDATYQPWASATADEIIQNILKYKQSLANRPSTKEQLRHLRALMEGINNRWSSVDQHALWQQLYGKNKNSHLSKCSQSRGWVQLKG